MQGKPISRESLVQRLAHLPFKHLAKVLVQKVREDDLTGLGAEIAYNAVFAIPAFLLFLVTLAAVVNQFTGVPPYRDAARTDRSTRAHRDQTPPH